MTSKKKERLDEAAQEAMQSELSGSVLFQPTSPQVGKTTSGQTDKPTKPQVEKYTTHLTPDLIQAIKVFAVQHKLKDYEVAQAAFTEYLERHASTTENGPSRDVMQ